MARKPTWAYDGDGYTHTTVTARGVALRCYDGIWCAHPTTFSQYPVV